MFGLGIRFGPCMQKTLNVVHFRPSLKNPFCVPFPAAQGVDG